jgi:3-hydroxy-9,10-secoandrosta-1,3,5(10)-triene-9,17-dione monooxygenase reductase component
LAARFPPPYSARVPNFDSAQFRKVLGHFPTGVTVITGIDTTGAPTGLTIGSFASVSLDPPLVGFFPGFNSTTWPTIAPSGRFCVNILHANQSELCWLFAKDADNRFDGIEWSSSPLGQPILPGVIGWIDCEVEHTYEMGDHWFVLGRVTDLAHADEADDAMIFFRGKVAGINLPS